MNTIKKLALGYALRFAWSLTEPHVRSQLTKRISVLRTRLTRDDFLDDTDMGRCPDFIGGETA